MPDPVITPSVGAAAGAGTFLGSLITAIAAGRRGGLSEEDRKTLQGLTEGAGQLEQRLASLEQQLTTVSATVTSHREEDGGTRAMLTELRGELRRLAEEARPALEGWRRERERLGDIEDGAKARGARLEEVDRQVRALHGRLDELSRQLREQLPPGLTQSIEGLISGAHALRHAIEDRFSRRSP